MTGRSPGVVSGWSIHGQSEPVAPGVQQGKAGPGSLARRPRGAWDGLGREVLPRLLWRLWVWRGQLCGRGTRGWAQHTRIACGNRPGRGAASFQPVPGGHHGATLEISVQRTGNKQPRAETRAAPSEGGTRLRPLSWW